MKYRTKEFKGKTYAYRNGKSNNLDDKMDEWLKKHPNIKILEFKYGVADKDNSSVMILYVDS